MATTTTTNLQLVKPDYSEAADVSVLNQNADKIDAGFKSLEVLVVNCGTISSLPKTVTNASITNDMVALQATLGTPAAQLSDWTVSTSNGSLTISGTISGSTALTLYLMKSR